MTLRPWLVATIVAVVGVIGVFVLWKVVHRTDSNHRAVIVVCDVLNDKIRQAQLPPPPESSTALLISELVALLPPGKAREFHRRLKEEQKMGGRLTEADCEAAARRTRREARFP